ncbi:MAG: hypothetical protein UH080_00040 [Ruminococcus sp.]|nr:hypothetical protein [Ruminococcus sp.]
MKAKELSILLMIFMVLFAFLCLSGCNNSCLDFACEVEDGKYCLGGISCYANSCDACTYTYGNIDYEIETDKGNISDVTFMSCDSTTLNCTGESGCYNACFVDSCNSCGNCENCGIVIGSISHNNIEEKTIGCMDGEFTCENSYGIWEALFDYINQLIGIGRDS